MKSMASEEFYSALKSNEYGRQYLELIEKVQSENRGLQKEQGYNIHHVHPRGLGGPLTDSSNLIKLTCFEHCLAHALLAKTLNCSETLFPIHHFSQGRVKQFSDLEKVQLEDLVEWSTLVEEARNASAEFNVVKSQRPEWSAKRSAIMTGRVHIYRGESEGKFIYPEELSIYLADGWVRGSRPSTKERQSGKSKGRIYIHRGDEDRRIWREELNQYLEQGWEIGRSKSFEDRMYARHTSKLCREKHALNQKGRISVKKGILERRVRSEEVQAFLDAGWIRGRNRKRKTE